METLCYSFMKGLIHDFYLFLYSLEIDRGKNPLHTIFFPPRSFCNFQVVSYVVLLSHITYKFIISSSCNLVHGGWSKWSGWTSCSQTCGTGSQERSRSCTNPKPKYGGRLCTGVKNNKRICNRQRCPGKNKCSFTEWKHCVILS